MEARLTQLRTQLKDGKEALDAFVREHGHTGDYELFAAAVQSLEQQLHEVEARAVPLSFGDPEDELALALADFQAFGAETQRQTTPTNRHRAARGAAPGSGMATVELDESASMLADFESSARTRSVLSRASGSRANIGTPGAGTSPGRGSTRGRKQAFARSIRSTRASRGTKSPQRGAAPRSNASQQQKTFARLVAPDRTTRDELFARFDYNGNSTLSLAEIDKAIVELWPEFNHKPALMRAYKAADVNQDGWVGRKEFGRLLEYLVYFNNLWHRFEEIDLSGDQRLSLEEFAAGCVAVGEKMTDAEIDAEFARIDTNGGGYVLFDEFCAWCAQRHAVDPTTGPAIAPQSEYASGEELPHTPAKTRRVAQKQSSAAEQMVPRTSSRTVRWGAVEVSPDPPSRTTSDAGIGLVMADTDALVRSFELSMRQSVPSATRQAVAYSAGMLDNVAKGYTQQSERKQARDTKPTKPLSASTERFYTLLAMHQHDQQWQRARSCRFETATKAANERCTELESLVTEMMSMADLGTLRFNSRRKLTGTMKYFIFELRLRIKMTAFLGWTWVVSRKHRDEHVMGVLRTQIAMTQLVNVVQAWKSRVAETRRMRVVARKLERKLGAIGLSRVWWAWRDVVLSNDWWRMHVKKCTGIVYRSLLRSRLRQWHGVVTILGDKRREFMIAKALMARQRLAIAMESWVQACVVSQRQVGMISRVRRAVVHLAFSRWVHATGASLKLRTQLESSILKNVAARWMNRRLARCFDAFYNWFEKKSLQKSRLRLVGKFSSQSGNKKVLTRCLSLWRLHASTAATATEVAKEAGEAAEAAATIHNQAMLHLREQMQTESSLQLQRAKEELSTAAEEVAKSAQAMLEIEVTRVQSEADVAAAEEARIAAERERVDLQNRMEAETIAATTAKVASLRSAEALASIEQKHAELVVTHQLQAEQAEAALQRRSPLPIEEIEEALLSHQRLQVAQVEAARANAAVEQLRKELQRLAVEQTANRNKATMERVEALRARAQRRRDKNVFGKLRDWCDACIALRQRLFAARRKLVRGCIRRALRAWWHILMVAKEGDSWFDKLPPTHMDLEEAGSRGYMEPIYAEEKIILIQAATRGYLLRKDRRKQAKLSAARLKTFLHGCGLSRHWPAAVRHNLTVAILLDLRDDQMKALGWSAADRRKLSKGLRLERAAMQRWVDSQEKSESSTVAAHGVGPPCQNVATMAMPTPQETITSPVLDALGKEAEQLRAQLQAVQLQEKIEHVRLSPRHASTAGSIPEGTPPTASLAAASSWRGESSVPTTSPVTPSLTGLEAYQPAREFHLLLTAMAGGADYQKFFHGQRSVSVFAGSVGELLEEISGALTHQGVSMGGPAELLYADRRAGGNLVVLTNIADLPSRASVVLNPARTDEAGDFLEDGLQEQQQLPKSLLACVENSEAGVDEGEEELPNSLLSFICEHSPEVRRRSPIAVTPARLSQSPALTPGSTAGLTPARRVAKIDALIDELMLA